MKSSLIIALLCMCVLFSCTSKSGYHHVDLSGYSILKPFESVIEFDDKFPADIAKKRFCHFYNSSKTEFNHAGI
jgi:hypothetical protein